MFRGNLIRTINRAFCTAKGLFFFPAFLKSLKSAIDIGLRRLPLEAVCWLTGLLSLALTDPSGAHFTLCPLRNAGFGFCPGCGLGRSVSLLFHGELSASVHAHPLGIFAAIVLSLRIINLTKQHLQSYGKSY